MRIAFVAVGLVLAAALVAACTEPSATTSLGPRAATTEAPATAVPIPTTSPIVPPVATTIPDPTAVLPATPTPTPVPTSTPALCPDLEAGEPAPERVSAALQGALLDPGFASLDVGVSIWIEGWGEVIAANPDLMLAPASNQKLLLAWAALDQLGPDTTLSTTAAISGQDLVLIAGGDPTLTTAELRALAAEIARTTAGPFDQLIIDASRYSSQTRAAGWQDWQIPRFVGPVSAFMVDDNQWTADAGFVADPAMGNGQRFADLLAEAGLSVGDVVVAPSPDDATVVATIESPPVEQLVRRALEDSDNQNADLLVLELGYRAGRGDFATGLAALNDTLREFCVPLEGQSDDGSGLSRSNQRSAREFRRLLLAALDHPVGADVRSRLAVSGASGTLSERFAGVDLVGRIEAKTGTILGGRSLSGYATSSGGRLIVFSIVLNGDVDQANAALRAFDNLVMTMVTADADVA